MTVLVFIVVFITVLHFWKFLIVLKVLIVCFFYTCAVVDIKYFLNYPKSILLSFIWTCFPWITMLQTFMYFSTRKRGTLKVSPILKYFQSLYFHHPSSRQPWTARILFIALSRCTLRFSCDTDLHGSLLRATGQGVSLCCISSGVNRELIIAGREEFLFWLLCVRHYSTPSGTRMAPWARRTDCVRTVEAHGSFPAY